jgi:methyl-accepting chemotaxis protein
VTVRAKLLASFLLVVALVLAVGLVGATRLSQLRNDSHRVSVEDIVPFTHASNLMESELGFYLTLTAIEETPLEEAHASRAEVRSLAETESEDMQAEGQALLQINTDFTLLAADQWPTAADRSEYEVALKDFQSFQADLVALRQTHSNDPAATLGANRDGAAAVMTAKDLVGTLSKQALAVDQGESTTYDNAKTVLIAAVAGALLLGIVLAVLFAEQTVRPLRRTVSVLRDVADGNLTSRLDLERSDEFGEMATALNTSIGSLHDVVKQIGRDADTITSYAAQASEQTRRVAAMLEEHGLGASATALVGDTEATAGNLEGMADDLHTMVSIFVTEDSPKAPEEPASGRTGP